MRLWHKDMLSVLPKQQLLSQWRECCCIARNIAVNGTPNHILVNKILDYPIEKDFYMYCMLVQTEMKNRGYKVSGMAYGNWYNSMRQATHNKTWNFDENYNIFEGWHNDRYLQQCFYNLQEKYDCGGIPTTEWKKVVDFMSRELTGITI